MYDVPSVSYTTQDHSLEQWQVVSRHTVESIAAQQRKFAFWKRSRERVTATLQEFIDLVYDTDPAHFTEQQFVRAEEMLNDVISTSEQYLTCHAVDEEFSFFSEAIRQLREARWWIIQGYSPRPDRRPSKDAMDQIDFNCSADVLRSLRSPE
jgi:hypothetical protein